MAGVQTERLEARIAKEKKAILRQAANLRGKKLGDFVISAAMEEAAKVIERERRLRLGAEQGKQFVRALLAKHEPAQRLRRAAERYKRSELAGG
jgi:uncharacterized protein (DUF1778 family)